MLQEKVTTTIYINIYIYIYIYSRVLVFLLSTIDWVERLRKPMGVFLIIAVNNNFWTVPW